MMQELLNEIPWPKPSKSVVNLEHIFSDGSQNDERNLLPSLTNHFECLTALPNTLLCKQQNWHSLIAYMLLSSRLVQAVYPGWPPRPLPGPGWPAVHLWEETRSSPSPACGLGAALCLGNSFHETYRHLVSLY